VIIVLRSVCISKFIRGTSRCIYVWCYSYVKLKKMDKAKQSQIKTLYRENPLNSYYLLLHHPNRQRLRLLAMILVMNYH